MERTLDLYYPAGIGQGLGMAVAAVLGGKAHVTAQAPAVLDLAALRCFAIRFQGSLMTTRAPFVYPLMDAAFHKYYLTPKKMYPGQVAGADWIYLGGNQADFLLQLSGNVIANTIKTITLRPFTDVVGEFSQTRQKGDVSLSLVKQPCFHNDVQVKNNMEMLLANSPDQWDESAYCLVKDRYDTIADLLGRYLTVAPKRIVEIGCGLGNTTHRLAREFPEARVTGYDFSADSIRVCRQAFSLPNLDYQVADFTKTLPLADGSVDLVVSIEATNMSAAPVFTAGECCRILSGSGLLLNCSLSESSYAYWDYPASLFTPVHMNTFATDWYAVARQAGFGFKLLPWNLMSFTFIACRDPEFWAAHQAFARSRCDTPGFRLYQDRFAMIIGANVAGDAAEGANAHLAERSYLGYVRRCLDTFDPADAELARFTAWSRQLVDAALGLGPEAYRFIDAVMPRQGGDGHGRDAGC